METTPHTFIDAIMFLAIAGGGFFVRTLNTSVRDLWSAHNKRGEKISEIELKVVAVSAAVEAANRATSALREHFDEKFTEILSELRQLNQVVLDMRLKMAQRRENEKG